MKLNYFELSEFDSPDKPGSWSNMNEEFLQLLDAARKKTGIPFKINSGFRTLDHNDKIGGSPTSSHQYGYAVDIACTDSKSRLKIVEALLYYFTRIGIAKTFIHVDADPDKPNAMWVYE